MRDVDYLWKVRCSETGDLVGDCGCYWCQDEIEVDLDDYDYHDSDWDDEDEEEFLSELTWDEEEEEDDDWLE